MLEHLVSIINQLLPEPQASLLAGMLFGVRRDMPEDYYNALIVTGTLHVIALSGMNVSIIIRLLFDMTGVFLGRVSGVVITLSGIIGFIFLVGPSETIIRASIMGSFTILAIFIGRKDIPLISLFLTVIAMIVIDFEVISSISFQLSVFATLGIILFAGPGLNTSSIGKKVGSNTLSKPRSTIFYKATVPFIWLWLFIKDDLRITLSAQVFTIPLIMFYFQRLSLISPIANVATGWLVAPITYLGFLMVALALIYWPLGRLAAIIVWVPLTLFVWIVEALSKIPYASIEIT